MYNTAICMLPTIQESAKYFVKRIQSDLGVTTIYITHHQMEAMAMSDRILVLENDYVKQIGTLQEIYASNLLGKSKMALPN